MKPRYDRFTLWTMFAFAGSWGYAWGRWGSDVALVVALCGLAAVCLLAAALWLLKETTGWLAVWLTHRGERRRGESP